MKNALLQLVLAAVLIVGAAFAWATYVPGAAPWLERAGLADLLGVEEAEAGGGGGRGGWGGGGPTQVVVAEVTQGRIDDRVEAIGDGRALRTVALRADVSGQIRSVEIAGGTRIEEGAVVIRLDDEAERIAAERARLVLDEARDDADRLQTLGDAGTVSEVRLREARLALRTAELALEQAEFDLSQRVVRAPIGGWVGVLDIAAGDRIDPSDVLATITDRSDILIDFRVPERLVGQVGPDTAFSVRPLGLPDTRIEGRIDALDNIVDAASRTLRVQGRVPNEDDRLRSGMAFAVTLTFPGEPLPAVDPLAVQWSAEGSFVWAVRDGKAERVPIVIRQRNADSVVVEAALDPGDPVVIEGVQSLRPGAEVSIVPGNETGASAALPNRARL